MGRASKLTQIRANAGDLLLCRITIEVNPESREVTQVRGKANRDPTEEERAIVENWSLEHQLVILDSVID
jgi:hypothetical protein